MQKELRGKPRRTWVLAWPTQEVLPASSISWSTLMGLCKLAFTRWPSLHPNCTRFYTNSMWYRACGTKPRQPWQMEAKASQWRERVDPQRPPSHSCRQRTTSISSWGGWCCKRTHLSLQKARTVQVRGQHCARNNVNGLIKGTLTKPMILQPGISGSGWWQPSHMALTSN